MLLTIYCYRWLIRPVIGDNCRFLPTCSQYAIDAINIYGPLKGFYLTIKRLLRCHPFSPGGVDPVINKRK